MKLLTLLPEDWKPEIDCSKADVIISEGILYLNDFDGHWICRTGQNFKYKNLKKADCAYSRTVNGLKELQPEPRPADSIKLSECSANHLILCVDENCRPCRATKSSCGWVVVGMTGDVHCHGDLMKTMVNFGGIKIYDMEQD